MEDTSSDAGAPVSVRVLVPDGGELESPQESEDQETEEADQETEEAEEAPDEAEGDEEAEDVEEAEDESEDEGESDEEGEGAEDEESDGDDEEQTREEEERDESEVDGGTRVLHLNLDGLFLDLLGLEVDLDEVTLDLTAWEGEGNLLGNLLSAVSGLLDGSGLGSLLGGDDGSILPSMPDLPNPIARARELASSLAQRIRDGVGDAIRSVVSALPLEELLTQFLQGLVEQLLDSGNGNGDEDASSA